MMRPPSWSEIWLRDNTTGILIISSLDLVICRTYEYIGQRTSSDDIYPVTSFEVKRGTQNKVLVLIPFLVRYLYPSALILVSSSLLIISSFKGSTGFLTL